MAAHNQPSDEIIDLTDVVEEGLPPENLGQDQVEADIDRVFSQGQGDMAQELLGEEGQSGTEPATVSADEEDELAALLKEVTGSEEAPADEERPPQEGADTLNKDDLDALLAEAAGQPAEDLQTEEEATAVDQGDLDALLAEAAGQPAEEPPTEEEPAAMDQGDLDALLAETEAEPAEEPPTEEEPAAMDQGDLDVLLAEAAVEPAEEPLREEPLAAAPSEETPPPAAPLPAQAIDQIEVETALVKVAEEVFERVAREVIPRVTEEVLTREIAALRKELEDNLD